jgi:ATP-dependent RNA helicase SUPV3L1/SUV3
MQNKLLAEKYPIHDLELGKNETEHAHLDELLKAVEAKAEADPTVRLIAAYRWFAYRLSERFIDQEMADACLAPWISVVDGHLRSRYRQGVGGGRKGVPSWYWPVRH